MMPTWWETHQFLQAYYNEHPSSELLTAEDMIRALDLFIRTTTAGGEYTLSVDDRLRQAVVVSSVGVSMSSTNTVRIRAFSDNIVNLIVHNEPHTRFRNVVFKATPWQNEYNL